MHALVGRENKRNFFFLFVLFLGIFLTGRRERERKGGPLLIDLTRVLLMVNFSTRQKRKVVEIRSYSFLFIRRRRSLVARVSFLTLKKTFLTRLFSG
jgi:hypothetical protein